MRWNCPHCGVGLNVPDEQLGESWCFSKCYQCSGFSLVRRTEQSPVRVDAGAQMLHESPWKLSQRATEATQSKFRPVRSEKRPESHGPSAVQEVARQLPEAKVVPPPFNKSKPLPAPLPDPAEMAAGRLGRAIYKFVTRSLAAGVIGAVGVGIYTWMAPPPAPAIKVAQVNRSPSIEAPKVAVVSDSISRGAMAPDRQKEKAITAALNERAERSLERATGFEVEALTARVQLRSGPGLGYSVVGIAGPSRTYPVVDWSERWFRISVEQNADGTSKTFAWVRNDLVKLVKKSR